VHDSSTKKTIMVGLDDAAGQYNRAVVFYYNDMGSFNAAPFVAADSSFGPHGWPNDPEWFQIVNNGTQYVCQVSFDNRITWTTVATLTISSYFTADKVGFLLNTFGGGQSLSNLVSVPFYDDGDAFPPVTPHYFVAAEVIEVASSGAQSKAVIATEAVEVLNSGVSSKAIITTMAFEVLSTVALKPERAIDGGKIYEFEFAFQPETQYQDKDYDSIWGVGDRAGNGLIRTFEGGWGGHSGTPDALFNDNWGLAAGDGYGVPGQAGWPIGAYWGFEITNNWVFLTGIRFHASTSLHPDGFYALLGGFDGAPWALATGLSFDEFSIGISATDPDGGTVGTLNWQPLNIPWNYFQITLADVVESSGADFDGANWGSEVELELYHSILDGGDRRSTNGRAAKRVTMTASSGIVPFVNSMTTTAFDNLFDGKYFHANAGGRAKITGSKFSRVGGTSGDDAITAAGEYFQFSFPRSVGMRDMVWCASDAEVYDSGGDPTIYGRWQWFASNSSGSGYLPMGTPWSFMDTGSNWLRAPPPLPNTNVTDIYPFWRMVLVEGPALGGGPALGQIQFNLLDPSGQSPVIEIKFTDDTDGVLPLITIGAAGSPTQISLTDAADDAITTTLTIVNNPLLSATFSDAIGDGLQAWGSFYPSTVVQSIAIVKGR
jgi:hypothetical protein